MQDRPSWMHAAVVTAFVVLSPGLESVLRAQVRPPPNVETQGRQILLDGSPLFLRGVCYSPFIAGDAPWIASLRHVDFAADMADIRSNLNADAVRVFQVLPRSFYDAARAQGLYVIQGIHLELMENVDPFDASFFRGLRDHVFAEIDKIHGYNAHDRILCYVIGNEIPASIQRNVILGHQDRPRYSGRFYSVPDATKLPRVDQYPGCPPPGVSFPDPHPMQSLVAELVDLAAARDTDRGMRHIYGHAASPLSSPTVDLKDRPDPLIFLPVDWSFLDVVFQNVYSYNPPVVRFKGYRTYLDSVADCFPDKPFVVLEAGFSTSPERVVNECAHPPLCGQPSVASPTAFCYGGNSEHQQARGILAQWEAVTAEPVAASGYFVFEYYDEWWKSELPIDVHDGNRPEEWFGIKAVEGTAQRPEIRNKVAWETVRRIFDTSWCPGAGDLICTRTPEGVEVSIRGGQEFDTLVILRDARFLVTLREGDTLPWMDVDPPEGRHVYTARVTKAHVACAEEPSCEIIVEALEAEFRRGDADATGRVNITDAIFVLEYLFLGRSEPSCPDAADADDNGAIAITDAIRILSYLFVGNAIIEPPGPSSCGPDPSNAGERLLECRYPAECDI